MFLFEILGDPWQGEIFEKNRPVLAQGGSCHRERRVKEEAENHLNWTWKHCYVGEFASDFFGGRSFFQVVEIQQGSGNSSHGSFFFNSLLLMIAEDHEF